MTCVGNSCGTGGWGGPLPGDPSNDITLSANGTYGGINIVWSIPTTNGFAVSFVNVYRGTSDAFSTAAKIGIDTDGRYFDEVEANIRYYYWIEVVSINGTMGAKIGPVSAVARLRSEQTLEDLTEAIDDGKLAQALKDKINGITLTNAALYKEIDDRIKANAALQIALTVVQSNTNTALTYISTEITDRKTADSALVSRVDTLAAGYGQNAAAITNEATVRANADGALANTISTLFAQGGAGTAALIEERKLWASADQVIVNSVTLLGARIDVNQAAISDILNLNVSPSSALATRFATLASNTGAVAAAVQNLDTALTNGTHALAQRVSTVEASLGGDTATATQQLRTDVDHITGELNAMYFAKVQVNGLIGGFGIWNNGTIVEAGFDVDRFWVGRTNDEKVKPFIIDNDIVYLNKARIRDADIDTLKVAGQAITVPSSAYTDGGASFIPGQTTTIQTLVIQSSGYPVLLQFAACIAPVSYLIDNTEGGTGSTDYFSWRLELWRNGSPLLVLDPKVPVFIVSDVPNAGQNTYQLKVYSSGDTGANGWNAGTATKRTITSLETKR
jgi:hypothetical protein